MASDLLHIKDSYYFEIPKFMWPSNRKTIGEFPDFWVRLDPEFQQWEADKMAHELELELDGAPDAHDLVDQWLHWQHSDHANHGRPLDVYLEMQHDQLRQEFKQWKSADKSRESYDFIRFMNETEPEFTWFVIPYITDEKFQRTWRKLKQIGTAEEFKETHRWDETKIESYNAALKGKVLIPQPFGQLRNLYQAESGFCISKYMIIEVVLALLLVAIFSWLAKKMKESERPKGRVWNLLEAFLLFLRDDVTRPAIGGGHDHDEHDEHGHGHKEADSKGHGHSGHGHGQAAAAHAHPADQYVPLLWTMFFFVLGCNLFGMVPWAGAPTSSFGVTTVLAMVTFATGMLMGMREFGPLGFFANQVPTMDLPLPIALVVKPMLLAIELLGLCIKHAVLAIRLLANMVAGHLVLLGLMGLAFGAHAATQFQGDSAGWWGITAVIAVVGSTLFSCLELFVAFLQAYIFTFLSALFIGASTHEH